MEGYNTKQQEFSWTSHPAVLNKKKTIFSGFIIILFGYVVFIGFQSIYWSLFSVIILIFSLKQFYFPVHYSISNKGIRKKFIFGNNSMDWTEITRFSKNNKGGILYSHPKKSFLDYFSGIELQFEQNAEEVIQRIESMMKKNK